MMAGINIIVATLTFLNDIFTQGFGMKGYITDVAAIAGQSGIRFRSGADADGDLCRQYYYRPPDAAEIYFLTGQALLWMATIGAVIGYKAGLTGCR
jgi:PTS system ascorbate-specific IIC component